MDDVIEAGLNDMGEIEVKAMCPYCGSIWRITKEDVCGHTLFRCPICDSNIYISRKYFNRSEENVS